MAKTASESVILTKLDFKNFRNLDLGFTPDMGFNLIHGANGAGKSNFLDGIYHLAFGKSFKQYSEQNNIAWESKVKFATLSAEIQSEQTTKLRLVFSQSERGNLKRFEVNDNSKVRRTFTSYLKLILFAPHNLNLIAGEPELRREELDDFLSSLDYEYADNLAQYKTVVRSRNKLLARIAEGEAQIKELSFWDQKLLELGSGIVQARLDLLAAFKPALAKNAIAIFDSELRDLEITYLSKLLEAGGSDVRTNFAQKLSSGLHKELAAKKTLYGPHRDDFELYVKDKNLKVFGSRGQQRLATIILKIALWKYLNQEIKQQALILLDDIMSELDQTHRAKLEQLIIELGTQTFITATETNFFTKKMLKKSKILELEN